MIDASRVALRWAVGAMSPLGHESLRLSVWGAYKLFGPDAAYTLCVNGIEPFEAARRTGALPYPVTWIRQDVGDVPASLVARTTAEMAGGAVWRLVPGRLFPDRFEITLEPDLILWKAPPALVSWLGSSGGSSLVMAGGGGFGRFALLCGALPVANGLLGLGPEVDHDAAMARILAERQVGVLSEADEQGLEIAALLRCGPIRVIAADDLHVSRSSSRIGRCGVQLVGLGGREALRRDSNGLDRDKLAEHWEQLRQRVHEQVGIEPAHRPLGERAHLVDR